MSILFKLKRMRASRWVAIVAVAALMPLAVGCTTLETASIFWGLGYAHELLFSPARALVGGGLLDFINSH